MNWKILIPSLIYLLFILIKSPDQYFVTTIGIGFSIYVFFDLINKMGVIFPIKEMILLIACLQWIIGAKISYSMGSLHHKYFMYVDETTYMNYVVPGTILFRAGLHFVKVNLSFEGLREEIDQNRPFYLKAAKTLLFIGVASTFLRSYLSIAGLEFILFLGGIILYVGIIYMIFLYYKRKFLIFAITIAGLLLVSLSRGMFHDLFLVGSFLTFFLFSHKTKFLTKVSIIFLGIGFAYTIQIVKEDFREVVWKTGTKDPVSVFYNVLSAEFLSQGTEPNSFASKTELDKDAQVNNRVNQGWIISRVLENIPKNRDFLRGETIKETLKASLIPRFISPGKKGGGYALEIFREATGLDLMDNTTMGLSTIGEFYANYGLIGGKIAMFLYGIFLAIFLRFFLNVVGNGNPVAIIWIVLLLYQVVKAETNFIMIFNHLTKSFILYLILNGLLNMMNIRLFRNLNISSSSLRRDIA